MICSFAKHPFYLGVTDIKYNAKEKTLQSSVKLFTNDLEEALGKLYKQKVDLINGQDKEKLNSLLSDYLKSRLIVKVNGKLQLFTFLGFEHEADAVWMYLEFKNCPTPKKVEVSNSLLYDFVKTQTNIVHCEVNGNKKSAKVSNPEKTLIFQF